MHPTTVGVGFTALRSRTAVDFTALHSRNAVDFSAVVLRSAVVSPRRSVRWCSAGDFDRTVVPSSAARTGKKEFLYYDVVPAGIRIGPNHQILLRLSFLVWAWSGQKNADDSRMHHGKEYLLEQF